MKMSAPKTVTWLIAIIIGGLGILIHQGVVKIAGLSAHSFWLVAIAFVLLAIAALIKGL
jgi:hypothetical protein